MFQTISLKELTCRNLPDSDSDPDREAKGELYYWSPPLNEY